jgi:transposase
MDPNPTIRDLQHQLAEALRRIDELVAENRHLRDQLDQAQREAARQAAPFRQAEAKKIPPDQRRRPGRPVGHPGVNRRVPDHVDATLTVGLPECPHCHGPVHDCQPLVQLIEEIPPVRPQVIRLITTAATCPQCGPVASTHPLQAGRGHHASRVQLGPRALALGVVLNKQHGLTLRKTCRVLKDLCGLSLSAGGLSQALNRVADRLDGDYQALFADLRAGPATYADETSWWVGGPGHWLWTFTSPTTTLYQVRASRAGEVVTSVLGPHYPGVLVSDCLTSYDGAVPFDRKHKCIAHHQKAIRTGLDHPSTGDRTYLEAWRSFFRQVSAVWKVWAVLPSEQQAAARTHYAARRDELLAQVIEQPEDLRIRNRLSKQQPYLLTCLEHPEAEPTNNRAERALRPAVIARKLSCGNRTERGKTTFEVLTSLATTWVQRGLDVVGHLTQRCQLHSAG